MTRKTTPKKPGQLDRIDSTLQAIERRGIEQGKVLDSICRSLALDMGDRLIKAHTDMLHRIQDNTSLLLKGSEIGEKEEPWMVGDLVTVSPYVSYGPIQGKTMPIRDIDAVQSGFIGMTMPDGSRCSTRAENITRATPAEVQKYEEQVKAQEWAKVDELQDWDACECTKSEQADLWAMGSAFAYHSNSNSLNLRWDPDYGRTKLVKTSRPDQFSPKHPLNWIPVAEFRRRLEGTISKRKAQEQEAKIAKLKFGTRVEYEDDRGWKVAMDKPTPDGSYVIVKEGHARMAWAKSSQLTLIDP